MGRTPCCSKELVNRGAWSSQEDQILINYIKTHGEGKWRNLPQEAGLNRCGKSCRLRWLNYLRPDIKRGDISKDEEDLIIRLHSLLGNRWSLIAGRLPGRTDNEIKNYWNTNLAKRLCYDKKPSSKSTRKQTRTLQKKLVKHDQVLENIPQLVRTRAIRCSKTKSLIVNQDQGSHDYQMAANNANEWLNDNDHNAASSNAMDAIDTANEREQLGHDQDHGQSSSNNTNTNTTTSTPKLEEEHDPFGFLIDLDVGNIDIVFDQNRIDTLNSNVDAQLTKDDRALDMNNVGYDPLELLIDTNSIETKIEDKVDEDDQMKREPKMEINLMLELKKVASFLELEDEWNDM